MTFDQVYPPGHESEGMLIEDEDGAPLPPTLPFMTPTYCHQIVADYYARVCTNPCGHADVFKEVGDDEFGEVIWEVVELAEEGDSRLEGAPEQQLYEILLPYVTEFRHYLQRCPR